MTQKENQELQDFANFINDEKYNDYTMEDTYSIWDDWYESEFFTEELFSWEEYEYNNKELDFRTEELLKERLS